MKIFNTTFDADHVRIREESFGGIIAVENPPALIYVDHDFLREMGYKPSKTKIVQTGEVLSAPVEVHVSLTNECPMGCAHCYTDSGSRKYADLTTEECKRVLKQLADMGVFHIAFGGGECFCRQDFLELARYCRTVGMVPNVTSNGFYITADIARQCSVFGKINISLDGVGENYGKVRGHDGFHIAERALRLLIEAGIRPGINCVITRDTFTHLPDLVRYAENTGITDILFLRFKPSGRARSQYFSRRLTPAQTRELPTMLLQLQSRTPVALGVDCSLVPMLCYTNPPIEDLKFYAAQSCEAGNILLGMLPDGHYQACSHCPDQGGHILDLPGEWYDSPHLEKFRNWHRTAPEPCKSCVYKEVCKGGCHVIAEFVNKDFATCDPECPRVVESLGEGEK